ncbi:hypothetical protein D3C87_1933340 [compost metagenome]
MATSSCAHCCGIISMVRAKDKLVAQATINSSMPDSAAVSTNSFRVAFSVSSPKANRPTTMA